MPNANVKFDVAVVGAGPAGSSLAIRLAKAGFSVALIEKDRFPRHKLCGEFISPECIDQFKELGVDAGMLHAGGDRISETLFYSEDGDSVCVPSDWFDETAGGALGLSRSEMDMQLIAKAESLGVETFTKTAVTGVEQSQSGIQTLKIRRDSGERSNARARVFVDATGRSRVLTNLVTGKKKERSRWIAFKAHFRNVSMKPGRCEIYFFEGGYGGLSYVENGFANHCFLIRADVAKENGGKAEDVFQNVVLQNERARKAFEGAKREFDWLAVAIDRFGFSGTNPAPNVFSIGDSAAFIDPFTGSGMLLALQSAELFAEIAVACDLDPGKISTQYSSEYNDLVRRRMLICRLMRTVSFSPAYANVVIKTLKGVSPLRQVLAKATRRSLRT